MAVTYDLASGAEVRRSRDTDPAGTCAERYVCAVEPGSLTITDAASGAVRYRGRSDQHLIDGDRLIVSWEAVRPEPANTQVYDLRTGRRLHEYPGWRLATYNPGADVLVQELSGDTLLVSTVDPGTGRRVVAGRATGWTGFAACTRGERYVGCVGPSGLRVWRLPPAG